LVTSLLKSGVPREDGPALAFVEWLWALKLLHEQSGQVVGGRTVYALDELARHVPGGFGKKLAAFYDICCL
jgi:hypothetical protein